MNKGKIIFILCFGLIAISFSSIFIKMCNASVLIITLYRVGIASGFYYAIARISKGSLRKAFTRADFVLAIFAGVALSLHFVTWIASLRYTTVSSSVVLVATSPIWVSIGSFLILKEKLHKLMFLGVFITLFGSILISGIDFAFHSNRLLGNLLAIAGALFAAIYLLIGRKIRKNVDTFQYVAVVYGAAAVFTFLYVLLRSIPFWGFDTRTVILLLVIALLPQIIGHTTLNWALKYFSATAVAIVTLGEPIGATLLAWIILGERLVVAQIVGGSIILFGVSLTLFAETRAKRMIY